MENKIVYVVMEDNGLSYDDYEEEIIGIFTTKENAEKVKTFMEENKKTDYTYCHYNYYVEEYKLNTFECNLKKYEIN